MKKWLIAFIIVVILIITSTYFLIPGTIHFTNSLYIKANREGLYRNLINEETWRKWWPGTFGEAGTATLDFFYKNSTYSIGEKTGSSIIIPVVHKDIRTITSLLLIRKNIDSTELVWEGDIPTTLNPVKRVQVYFDSKKISEDLSQVLQKMQSFFSITGNVYGYDIRQELVKDSILISTYNTSNGYPSTAFIYDLIDQLKKYISLNAAKEIGFPMLNVNTADSIHYLTRVAIPVNKKLPSSGNISYKWMLGGGNILVADVQGGPWSIANAFKQMENYVNDYQRIPPAIPFLSLITDRVKEMDTSKWVTRIYYPVI
jgi:hypothetical protein